MSEFGYWASIFGGIVLLTGALIARFRPPTQSPSMPVWNAMGLLGVAMIIGPLPWALHLGGERLRIMASSASILASISAVALFRHQVVARTRRHNA